VTPFIAVSVAAIAGAPHCLGMCGPLACAGSSERGFVPYHLGRIGVYAILGAVAGAIGDAIPGPPWVMTTISAVLLVGFTAALAGWLPEPKFAIPGLAKAGARFAKQKGPFARLAFGVVNGLLPCGLLYATLAIPVSTGSAVVGAMTMTLFGVLTAIPLTAAAFGMRKLMRRPRVRMVMAGLVLASGLYTLSGRGAWFSDEAPSCHEVP